MLKAPIGMLWSAGVCMLAGYNAHHNIELAGILKLENVNKLQHYFC